MNDDNNATPDINAVDDLFAPQNLLALPEDDLFAAAATTANPGAGNVPLRRSLFVVPKDEDADDALNATPPDNLASLQPGATQSANPASQTGPASSGNGSATTPEMKAAAIKDLLEADAQHHARSPTLIFEYGPFDGIEQQIRAFANEVLSPEAAEAVISHVRMAIHDVVIASSSLRLKEATQDGLHARIDALKKIDQAFKSPGHPAGALLSKLHSVGLDGIDRFGHSAMHLTASELQRMDRLTRKFVPEGLGQMLFRQLQRLRPTPAPTAVNGDIRRTRNDRLLTSLGQLTEVANEIKANAGVKDWGLTQGQMCTQEASRLQKEIASLTAGVEDQLDSRAFKSSVKKTQDILNEASAQCADPEFKGRIDQLKDSLGDMVRQLVDALTRMLSKAPLNSATP